MTDNQRPVKAEIIAIGTELTSGQKLDTNSQWLSLELAELGIPVHWHTTVADDLDENVQALAIAADRADIVLITGGLGPTLDDLTRDALAQLAPSPIVELNRAVALAMAYGPAVGLALVDQLLADPSLANYHLLPSVRGDLLARLGRDEEARTEFARAAELARNERERALLLARAQAV